MLNRISKLVSSTRLTTNLRQSSIFSKINFPSSNALNVQLSANLKKNINTFKPKTESLNNVTLPKSLTKLNKLGVRTILPQMEEQIKNEYKSGNINKVKSTLFGLFIFLNILGLSLDLVKTDSGISFEENPAQVIDYIISNFIQFKDASLSQMRLGENTLGSTIDMIINPSPFTIPLVICTLIFGASYVVNPSIAHRHFTCSLNNIRARRIHTLLTSAYTHFSPMHFIFNMVCLASFSSLLIRIWSPEEYLIRYNAAAIFTSAVPLFLAFLLKRNPVAFSQLSIPSIGASGVGCAFISYIALRYPDMNFKLMLLPFSFQAGNTLKTVVCIESLVLLAIILRGFHSPISHAAHLSGYLFGLIMYLIDKKSRSKVRSAYR